MMRASVFAASFLLFLPFSAAAQETGSGATTGTGMIIAEEAPGTDTGSLLRRLDLLAAEASARGIASRGDLLTLETKFAQLKDERKRQEARRLQHRTDCRERLRKANRDQQAEVAATCFKEALSLELSILRKERAVLALSPGLSPDVRSRTVDATDALADAVDTVIQAVDAGLYTETSEVQDAKARLHVRYRAPRSGLMLLAEADVDRAWNALLALRLEQRINEAPELLEAPETVDQAIGCLERQQAFWGPETAQKTYAEIKLIVSQFRSGQAGCIQFVRSVNHPPEPAGTEAAPEAE